MDEEEEYSEYGETPNESAGKLDSPPVNNFNNKTPAKQNQLLST